MCRITVLSLESLFVRSAIGGFPCVVLQCCYCVVFPCVVLLVVFVTLYAKKYHVVSLLIEIQMAQLTTFARIFIMFNSVSFASLYY